MGVAHRTVTSYLCKARKKAAAAGYSPEHDMVHTVPDGFHVRGVSTYYDVDGKPRGQWVKSQKDRERYQEAIREAVASLIDEFGARGASKVVRPPKQVYKELLPVYPMGDPHLGMLAWDQETGAASFDLKIAERNLVTAVDQLVGLAPPSAEALVVNVGDFFHTDNPSNRTNRSGHALDVDTRYGKMMRAGTRTMRRVIDQALRKHKIVRIICEIGNHDPTSSLWLSHALALYYENNPRVIVDESPNPFHYLRFGKVLIGTTHGDEIKINELPGVMAHDRPQDWGETLYRYWITGHIHHITRRELPGCIVESFRTLAPRDYWHHKAGYRSGRSMDMVVYHRDRGEVLRHVVGVGGLG